MGMDVAVPAGSLSGAGDSDRLQDAVEFQAHSSAPQLPRHHGVSVLEHVQF